MHCLPLWWSDVRFSACVIVLYCCSAGHFLSDGVMWPGCGHVIKLESCDWSKVTRLHSRSCTGMRCHISLSSLYCRGANYWSMKISAFTLICKHMKRNSWLEGLSSAITKCWKVVKIDEPLANDDELLTPGSPDFLHRVLLFLGSGASERRSRHRRQSTAVTMATIWKEK